MTTREEFEAWWFDSNAFEYGQTDAAWAAWQASRNAALEEAAKECEKAYSYDPEGLIIADNIRILKGE